MKNLVTLVFSLLSIGLFSQDCSTPTGQLTWDNPTGFDTSEDVVLVFAKKVPLGTVTYMNIETPTQDPTTYGTPDTNLVSLEGTIPANIQYENDVLGMLVYNDTGEYVNLSGHEDSVYFFTVFNVDNGFYSNAIFARGKTIAVEPIREILLANATRTQWIKPDCYDTDTVIVAFSTDTIIYTPSGYASQYLDSLNTDYDNNNNFLNGVNDSDGKVLYVDWGDRMTQTLPEGIMHLAFYVNRDNCWSKVTVKKIDTR